MLEAAIFGTFAGLLLFSAVMVVFAYQAIHAALWLMVSFFSAAALWILLNAEFLGLMLILVYVGAILTLFLFVIMTLSTTPTAALSRKQYFSYNGSSIGIVITGLGCILYGMYDQLTRMLPGQSISEKAYSLTKTGGNTQALGVQLYTDYVYPFELAGILLLVAVVVSISLHSDFQHPNDRVGSLKPAIPIKRSGRIMLVEGGA